MDTLVFDIETQNFFTDPEVGWDNFGALKISVLGLYSYGRNEYLCFEEGEMREVAVLFRGAERIVGFSINRYDIPVLTHYFQRLADASDLDLWAKERVDLLSEIEDATGGRISLSKLAEANLGVVKERHGRDAILLYRAGRMEELKAYCLGDVRLTKALYDKYLAHGQLVIPDKVTGERVSVAFKGALTHQRELKSGRII